MRATDSTIEIRHVALTREGTVVRIDARSGDRHPAHHRRHARPGAAPRGQGLKGIVAGILEYWSTALMVSWVSMRLVVIAGRSIETSGENAYIEGMEIFSMIFAILMIAAAVAATIFMYMFGGGIWAGLGFAALLVVTYRAGAYDGEPTDEMERDQLNAFQRPLSDD
ncbi:hypothetical protein CCR78_04170 [Rhodovulum imhoffii]|nr:hypothetical protein [Rhodovulum imhoffii]